MFNHFSSSLFLRRKIVLLYFVAISFFVPFLSNAATLSLSPSSTTVSVGNIFTTKIYVNTSGKSVNNGEVSIQFPTDMLEVVSVSRGSSIFSLWVEEPSFSNYSGSITLNGGVPNPGFTGSNGFVSSVTFKAKKQGTASIIFGDSAVRENDGLGTNILTSKNGSVVEIGLAKEIEVPITTDKEAVPTRPLVTSSTHPDQMRWYSGSRATFNWKIPVEIISIQALLDKKPTSIPTTTYDNSVTEKTINNISDGIYYFHLRYSNKLGWGNSAHYKINVDSTPPKPFSPTSRIEDNKNLIKFNAEDETSGIDYFVIHTDDNQTINIKNEELIDGEYPLMALSQGTHNISITAYDKAGNHTEASLVFTSSSISIPELSIEPNEITKGQTINISGKSDYFGKQVEITLKSDKKIIKTYKQTVSPEGVFYITTDKIKTVGTVEISAENILSDTVRSQSSESLFLKVNQKKAVVVTIALFWIIIFLALVIILLIALYVGWHKFFYFKKNFDDELRNTAEETHKSMLLLKEYLTTQLGLLEKIRIDRDLNKEEEAIFNRINEKINDIDKFIEKKLKKLM